MSSGKDASEPQGSSEKSKGGLKNLLASPHLQGIGAVLAIIAFLFGETLFVRFLAVAFVSGYAFVNRRKLKRFIRSLDLDSIRYSVISRVKSADFGEILAAPFIVMWWLAIIIFALNIVVSIIRSLINSREAFVSFVRNSIVFIREEAQLLVEPLIRDGVLPDPHNLRATSVAILFLASIVLWLALSNISTRGTLIEVRQYLDQFNEDLLFKIKSDWNTFIAEVSNKELHDFLQDCYAHKFDKGTLLIAYQSHELYRISQKRESEIKRELNSYFGNYIKDIKFIYYLKTMDYSIHTRPCYTLNPPNNSGAAD